MAVINEGEILARIHKFKLFREEGNLFIDIYEAIMGKPASKFIAVPNLIVQEADKEYFGFGDSKAEALKDCLKKIKDVPLHTVVPLENGSEKDKNQAIYSEPLQHFNHPSGTDTKKQDRASSRSLGRIYGIVADHTRPDGFTNDIIDSIGKKRTGAPIKNAKIMAVCKGFGKKKTRTDNSGYYEFTDLADGTWTLRIKARGYEMQETRVEIVGGGEYEENFD